MEYRSLDRLGISPSLLGYGCMRFPTDAQGRIDEPRAAALLDTAYRAGVNYFDTAVPYHGGESEAFVGRTLGRFARNSYFLATKLPSWDVKEPGDAERILAEQLRRLDKEYLDFYLLHALNREHWDRLSRLGVPELLERYKKEGKIRWLGFSFHDEYPVFEKILTSRNWDFCQIQLNYMDTEEQAGLRGYKLAVSRGVPVVVMEPVKGGLLAALPEEITAPLRARRPGFSVASWAFRWVGSLPGVKVILSGMSDEEQLADNLRTFDRFLPLDTAEQSLVVDAAARLRRRVNNGCTGCRYCMPCPNGVDIPLNFRLWNHYGIYGSARASVRDWTHEIADEAKAARCVACGQCEDACPQKLTIIDDLRRVQSQMDALCAAQNAR